MTGVETTTCWLRSGPLPLLLLDNLFFGCGSSSSKSPKSETWSSSVVEPRSPLGGASDSFLRSSAGFLSSALLILLTAELLDTCWVISTPLSSTNLHKIGRPSGLPELIVEQMELPSVRTVFRRITFPSGLRRKIESCWITSDWREICSLSSRSLSAAITCELSSLSLVLRFEVLTLTSSES
jgi:hypothetical protein